MSYKASVQVTGAPYSEYDNYFFDRTIDIEEETIGKTFDSMVAASLSLHNEIVTYIVENFDPTYDVNKDSWYVNCSFPSVYELENSEENLMGAGSSLHNPASVVQAVTHYRHMEIRRFFKGEIKYLADGAYNHYVTNIEEANDFYSSFETEDLNYVVSTGYLGSQLDDVIENMGSDYVKLMKIYNTHIAIIRNVRKQRVARQKAVTNSTQVEHKPKHVKIPKTFKEKLRNFIR
jgi:hypothetical protein